MLEYLSLLSELQNPDRKPWEKRTIITVLDQMERNHYMDPHEAERFHHIRDQVHLELQRAMNRL
jgi:hypothetical protein